jgi:hypothetical protein
MSQTYFSQSPLGPGQTSGTFAPPVPVGGSGAQTCQLTVFRDPGRQLADGTYDVNQPAVITVRQLAADGTTQVTLLITTCNGGGTSVELFIPDPAAGVCSIVNSGPGHVTSLSVSDLDVR